MKFVSGAILSVSLLAGFLAAVPVRAEDAACGCAAPAACEVPDYLLSGDNVLPKVAEAIKAGGPLNILVVGSRSSTINVGRECFGGSRLSRPDAGRLEGEAAVERG